jgi:nucleoside-diphosphate-sugar epimerase
MIHVEDLVRGIFLASQVKEANGRVYYLSGDGEWNWHAIGDLVARTLNKKPIRLFIPFWLLDAVSAVNRLAAAIKKRPALLNSDKGEGDETPNWLCSNARAKAELDFPPQSSWSPISPKPSTGIGGPDGYSRHEKQHTRLQRLDCFCGQLNVRRHPAVFDRRAH